MPKLLLKWESNWADEMDISGFKLVVLTFVRCDVSVDWSPDSLNRTGARDGTH